MNGGEHKFRDLARRMPDTDTLAPLVTVILPCRNEIRSIRACLESILGQASPEGGFEVIIADGMSDDGTRDVLREFLSERGMNSAGTDLPPATQGVSLRVIDNPGRIVSTGLNRAIREAKGQIIVRMDSHTVYAGDYLKACVECLLATGADNVGGPARTKAEGYQQKAIAAAYHSPFAVGGARFHDVDYEGPVDTVTYGCWWRDSFERFGMFDEELVRNQDDEHNLRIQRKGGRIWQSPTIRSWYYPRASLAALCRQYSQYGYWKVCVIRKHVLPASWRHLVPAGFVAGLLLLSLAGLGWEFMMAYGGQRGGGNSSGPQALNWPWFGLKILLTVYAAAILLASLWTAKRKGWALIGILPVVFPCYHVPYGWGFLRGILDFGLRRRKTSDGVFTRLTRGE